MIVKLGSMQTTSKKHIKNSHEIARDCFAGKLEEQRRIAETGVFVYRCLEEKSAKKDNSQQIFGN
jgi:hypothetical protein